MMSSIKKPLLIFGLPAILLLAMGVALAFYFGSHSKPQATSSNINSASNFVGSACNNFPQGSTAFTACSTGYQQGVGNPGANSASYCKSNYPGSNADDQACLNGFFKGVYYRTLSDKQLSGCSKLLSIYQIGGAPPALASCIKKPPVPSSTASSKSSSTPSKPANGSSGSPRSTPQAAAASTTPATSKDPLACDGGGGVKVSNALGIGSCAKNGSGDNNVIYLLIRKIVQFIIGLIGLALVLTIVIAGLQYITSDGSPDGAKAAKERIRNAAAGFLLLVSLTAILSLLHFNVFS
jgi:hypothetical protein